MLLDFSKKGKIIVDMSGYIKDMLEEFPMKFKDKDKVATLAANNLFRAGKRRRLDSNWVEAFHMIVAKGLFHIKVSTTGYTSDNHITMHACERPQ